MCQMDPTCFYSLCTRDLVIMSWVWWCWQLLCFSPVLCPFDKKKFPMPMVKEVLSTRTQFIFILFCREGSNGSKHPKPKKGISNVLRSFTISFFEPVPENLFQTSNLKSQMAICTTEQLTCILVFLWGLYLHLCSWGFFALH